MPDLYGSLPLPIPAPADPAVEAVADPALDVWAAYFKAYVNAHGTASWAACFPRRKGTQANPGDQVPPIRTTFTHQPTDETIAPFNESDLPALYLYRAAGPAPKYEGIDRRVARDAVTFLWVFPTGAQAAERIRVPYVNGLVKMVDRAIEAGRDPVYVHPLDPSPSARSLSLEPAAVRLGAATSTSAQIYQGAALDGAVGGQAFQAPRAFVVSCSGDPTAFVDGSAVRATGLDVLGRVVSRDVVISTTGVPGVFSSDHAFLRIDRIEVPPQASGSGVVSFGLGPYRGEGSAVLNFAGQGMSMGRWQAQPIAIPMSESRSRYYDALQITLEMYELFVEDLGAYDAHGGGEQTVDANAGGFVQTNLCLPP